MGCGCGKNKNNKIERAKAARKKTLADRLVATEKYRTEKTVRRKLIEQKLKSCRSCPFSTPTREELRNKTRVCHKTQTSIQAILNKPTFQCPLGHF